MGNCPDYAVGTTTEYLITPNNQIRQLWAHKNRNFHTTPRDIHKGMHAGRGRTEKPLTSREADDPDIQELLVRQALLELLPPVVGTARAARVVHLLLLQQWRSDALLLHWLALHRREAGEEQSRQVNSRKNARSEVEWRRRLRW